jgi:serine O-acetyltransferase
LNEVVAGSGEQIGFIAQVVEDWQTHERDWTRPGFQALLVHRFGVWRMGIAPRPLRMPLSALYKALYSGVRNFYGIEIPYTAHIGRRVTFEHQGGIVIHGHASVGDGSVIRQGVTLGNRRFERPHDAPHLGADVNVGAGAKILGLVSIGDGAQIGANAVVVSDVPAGAVVVGIPARIVQTSAEHQPEVTHTRR